jgi:virulence-associated protein VagC
MNVALDNTTKVFQNGNSRAIRLPMTVFRAAKPGDALKVEYFTDKVILRLIDEPRAGWDEKFKTAILADPSVTVSDQYGVLSNDSTIADGLEDYACEYDQ